MNAGKILAQLSPQKFLAPMISRGQAVLILEHAAEEMVFEVSGVKDLPFSSQQPSLSVSNALCQGHLLYSSV